MEKKILKKTFLKLFKRFWCNLLIDLLSTLSVFALNFTKDWCNYFYSILSSFSKSRNNLKKTPEFAYPLLFFSQYTIPENAFKKIEASPPLLLY